MKSWQFLMYMFAVAIIVGVLAFCSVGIEAKPEYIKNGWHFEDAPEKKAIIGVWGLGYASRSFVCVMIRGRAYAYDDYQKPVKELMPVRPRKWRGLED